MKLTLNYSASVWSLLALAMFASPQALAEDTGWYGGANVGRSAANIDDPRITSGLLGQGLGTTSIDHRDRDTAFKLYGGYQLTPHLAVEGGYFDLGKFGYTAHTAPLGSLRGDMRVRGLNLDLVGTVPLTDRLSLLGRVGVNHARVNDRFAGTGSVSVARTTASKSEANAKFGVGVNYAFNDALSMRLEFERYRVNDAIGNKGDIDTLSVGLVYRFGKTPRPTPRAAALEPVAVAAVVPTPSPPQQIVPSSPVVPAVVQPRRVSLSAESLFGFDASDIRPEGRAALDGFSRNLASTEYQTITVEGHTDRLGTAEYNQNLSEERAAAVKNYLVTSGRLDASKISAAGKGETLPVTKPGDCKGTQHTPALVACLQPDRRVDVEVTGTR